MDRDGDEAMSLDEVGCDALHLGLGHSLVGLVLEVNNLAAAGVRARRPDERCDRAGIVRCHLTHGFVDDERLLREPERPPETGGIRGTSSPPGAPCPRAAYALLTASDSPGGSTPSASAGQIVGSGRAGCKVDLRGARPGELTQAGEEANGDLHRFAA